MRSATQQIKTVTILDGETESEIQELYDQRIAAIAIPAASPLNTFTLSFVQVIDGDDYEVRKEDGTAFSITAASGRIIPLNENVALTLSQFKIKSSAAPTGDGEVILFGYSG